MNFKYTTFLLIFKYTLFKQKNFPKLVWSDIKSVYFKVHGEYLLSFK